MSNNILYISKWKEAYPFLNSVWNAYNQFDKSVDHDPYKYMYEGFCNPLMRGYTDNIKEQTNFCLKLKRNLGYYPPGSEYFDPSPSKCKILDYWIYNSLRKHKISDESITECYDYYEMFMRSTSQYYKCVYHSFYDNYEEPKNVIILDIFQHNMETVRDIVTKDNNNITDFRVQKYICECVNIYKEMYKKYCPKVGEDNKKRNNTCGMLNIFENTYKSFLSTKKHKNYNIPSLDNVEADYLTMCPQNNPRLELIGEVPGRVSSASRLHGGIDEDTGELSAYGRAKIHTEDSFTSSTEVPGENQNSSMTRTLSTTIGTVAGASSILALLYKFTPGRNLIRSGIRGSRGRMNSNFYEDGPVELLFDGVQGEDMSSYNARYNIGYGST